MKTWFMGVRLSLLLVAGLVASSLVLGSLGFGVSVAHAEMRSVAVPTANFRAGPSTDADIKFVGTMYFPVKVLKHEDEWTKVKDFEGDSAWVATRLLSKSVPTVVIKSKRANVREKPTTKSEIAFKVERGEVFKVLGRDGDWLSVIDINGERGWIFDRLVWGMKDHDAIPKKPKGDKTKTAQKKKGDKKSS